MDWPCHILNQRKDTGSRKVACDSYKAKDRDKEQNISGWGCAVFTLEKEDDVDDSCNVNERTETVYDKLFSGGLVEGVPGWWEKYLRLSE